MEKPGLIILLCQKRYRQLDWAQTPCSPFQAPDNDTIIVMINPALLPSQTCSISYLTVCFGVCSSAVESLQLPFMRYM